VSITLLSCNLHGYISSFYAAATLIIPYLKPYELRTKEVWTQMYEMSKGEEETAKFEGMKM
jgi:hypothetical protein